MEMKVQVLIFDLLFINDQVFYHNLTST